MWQQYIFLVLAAVAFGQWSSVKSTSTGDLSLSAISGQRIVLNNPVTGTSASFTGNIQGVGDQVTVAGMSLSAKFQGSDTRLTALETSVADSKCQVYGRSDLKCDDGAAYGLPKILPRSIWTLLTVLSLTPNQNTVLTQTLYNTFVGEVLVYLTGNGNIATSYKKYVFGNSYYAHPAIEVASYTSSGLQGSIGVVTFQDFHDGPSAYPNYFKISIPVTSGTTNPVGVYMFLLRLA